MKAVTTSSPCRSRPSSPNIHATPMCWWSEKWSASWSKSSSGRISEEWIHHREEADRLQRRPNFP